MKIGIITITIGNNYGNRLQNYALQTVLHNFSCEVETFYNKSAVQNNLLKNIKNYIKYFLKKTIFKNKYLILIERKKAFDKFNNDYICFSTISLNNKKISEKIILNYDYFICGSDQIWNPEYDENAELNFLKYVPKEKSISYAPSFGVYNIPKNKIQNITMWLKEFKSISVREERGKEIIKELINEDVEVLVDPTMLLKTEDWDKIIKKPEVLKKDKYILNYFLGTLSDERKQAIEKIAKENDCEIINILDKNNEIYSSGPSEFLYLEKNAFLICTDSFHSSVFAILFNRPFVIFEREEKNLVSMNSRIDTLINKFQLKDRYFNGNNITEENLNHDYTVAYEILEEERKKSENFLKNALEIKERK